MSEPASPTTRTTDWGATNAALRRRGSLVIWFDPETEWLAVPDFSTLGRRSIGLTVQIPSRPSPGALHLLIDSTGIKAAGEGPRDPDRGAV